MNSPMNNDDGASCSRNDEVEKISGDIAGENVEPCMNKIPELVIQASDDVIAMASESDNDSDEEEEPTTNEIQVYEHHIVSKSAKNKLRNRYKLRQECLSIHFDKLFMKIYHHIEVSFTPNEPKEVYRIALDAYFLNHYPKIPYIFDNEKNMLCVDKINPESSEVTLIHKDNKDILKIKVDFNVLNVIVMDNLKLFLDKKTMVYPKDELLAFDVLLQDRLFRTGHIKVDNVFFPQPHTACDQGKGIELCRGFVERPIWTSVPYVKIDVVRRRFLKSQPIIQYLEKDMGYNINLTLKPEALNKLKLFITTVKVDYMIPNHPESKRTHVILSVVNSAKNFFLKMENPSKGKKTSNVNVEQHYKKKWNYVIKYPNLPCLHVKDHENKTTAIPIELCTIARGQTPRR